MINQSDFVSSIRFLKKYQQGNRNQPIKPDVKVRSDGLAHIGNVLESIASPPVSTSPSTISDDNLGNRVLALEQKLNRIEQCIEELPKPSS